MHFVVIYFGMRCVAPETQKPSFAGHALLHEHIAWTFRPFLALTLDSQLFRGKMNPQKIGKKTNNVQTLRRKNGTFKTHQLNLKLCAQINFAPP